MKPTDPEFRKEYMRRYSYARYHGLPTKGIAKRLLEEMKDPANDPAFTREYNRRYAYAKYHGLPTKGIRKMLREEWDIFLINQRVKADLAELRKRHEAEERERRVLERQERKERRAEISREWNEYRETRTCETCKHADVIGIRPSNGTKILVCSVTGLGTKATYIACAKYDEEYINAIYDI